MGQRKGLPEYDGRAFSAGADIHGIREVARAGFERLSINGDDLKRATMNDPQSSSDST
jgi:enoyl-CoA hydratase/carnithine racemase